MRAPPWKSGASAPRKRFEINAGFSPGGHSPIDNGLFPHPPSVVSRKYANKVRPQIWIEVSWLFTARLEAAPFQSLTNF